MRYVDQRSGNDSTKICKKMQWIRRAKSNSKQSGSKPKWWLSKWRLQHHRQGEATTIKKMELLLHFFSLSLSLSGKEKQQQGKNQHWYSVHGYTLHYWNNENSKLVMTVFLFYFMNYHTDIYLFFFFFFSPSLSVTLVPMLSNIFSPLFQNSVKC